MESCFNFHPVRKPWPMNCRILFSVFLLSFLIHPICNSQTVKVTGQLLGTDGEPLTGVTIVIKGTATGVVTDANGNYTIMAPENATLVFSFIGFATREVPVATLINSVPGDKKTKSKNTLLKKELMNGSQTDDSLHKTASFYNFSALNKNQKRLLRKYDPASYSTLRGKKFEKSPFLFNLSLTSSFSADIISKMPALQKEYSQGRNESGKLVWQGPEDDEIFSWGPPLSSLEYDGIPYYFDVNGRIVGKGLGNGTPVNAYDPYSFFQKGFSNLQSLAFTIQHSRTALKMAYNYSNENGVIPHSGIKKNNFIINYNTIYKSKLKIDLGMKATLADIGFLSGFSQTHFMQSVLKTPVTFNNANRLNASSYLTNPYWLESNMIDNEKSEWLQGHMDIKYDIIRWLGYRVTGSLENQTSKDNFGFREASYGFPDYVLANRKTELRSSYFKTGVYSYNRWGDIMFNGGFYYEISNIDRSLARTDFSVSKTNIETDNKRKVYSLIPELSLNIDEFLNLELSASTIHSGVFPKTYLKPRFAIAFIPTNFNFYYHNWMNELKFFGSFSEGLNAAPLGYKRGTGNSILFDADNMYSYFETAEFLNAGSVKPEQSKRWECGANLGLFRSQLTSEFSFYTGTTSDFLIPQYTSGNFAVINGGDLHSSGFDLDISYSGRFNSASFVSTFTFSRNRTTVTKVISPSGILTIGGLSTVPVVLIKDKPYGVLMGTSYMQNENGQKLVGDDGFPLVDNTMKVIGNPNPRWTMGWTNDLSIRRFRLSFTFDLRKGGDIWNGTKSTLSYLGLSKESGSKRLIGSYVFDGVYSDGTKNHTPVSFYDPSLPLNQNRWVRYGYAGVASDAIEDGSWIRLSELSLSYEMSGYSVRSLRIKSLKLKVFASNIFVLTHYSGVDPQTRFLGSESNNGIDYFNTPGVRTYGASAEIVL